VEEPEDNWNCKGEKWKFERERKRERAQRYKTRELQWKKTEVCQV
jgi:hypothetical protein